MSKIIFFLWLLSGKVQPRYDKLGYLDHEQGRRLYIMGKDSTLFKGEVLNYIRTGGISYNENYSDRNGKFVKRPTPSDTLYYRNAKGTLKSFPVYGKGKKQYIIDEYLKCKVYIYKNVKP